MAQLLTSRQNISRLYCPEIRSDGHSHLAYITA